MNGGGAGESVRFARSAIEARRSASRATRARQPRGGDNGTTCGGREGRRASERPVSAALLLPVATALMTTQGQTAAEARDTFREKAASSLP